MGRPIKGEVVVVPFPFTDQKAGKVRPAVVVSALFDDEVILCQITSTERVDGFSIAVAQEDFAYGRLPHHSYARVCHLFTADSSVIKRVAGRLRAAKTNEIVEGIIAALRK